MKRSVKTVIEDAARLIWKDICNMKLAAAVIFVYLWIKRVFFRSSCIWVLITGFPCPGCGLTRAGVALLKGRFRSAFEIHPFIYAIVILFVVFCIQRYILKKSPKAFVKWGIALLVGMLVFYAYRMLYLFPGEPPMSYYRYNLIRTFSR